MTFVEIIMGLVFAYLLGSVPFGLVFARLMKLGDLRAIGSGNIGATNVLRTGNKTAAALTLIFDALKGGIAVLIVREISGETVAGYVAFAALLGHCFPVWLKFQGGKGVATFLGTVLVLSWPMGMICCVSWLILAKLTRISSVGGMGCSIVAPIAALVLGDTFLIVPLIGMSVLVIWRHKDNIARLKEGTEGAVSGKKQ